MALTRVTDQEKKKNSFHDDCSYHGIKILLTCNDFCFVFLSIFIKHGDQVQQSINLRI